MKVIFTANCSMCGAQMRSAIEDYSDDNEMELDIDFDLQQFSFHCDECNADYGLEFILF